MYQRPHWSFSAISQYLACPLRYYFQRVIGLPQATQSSSLVLGSAVHHALATYHCGLKEGESIPKEKLHEALVQGWKQRETEADMIFKSGETKENCIAQGIALIEAYHQEPPPQNIVAVEQEILAPLHNSQGKFLETPLMTVVDLITQAEDGLKVREFKTSGRSYSNMEAETSLQPTCYINAVQEVYGEPAKVEYTILVKTKTPRVQTLPAYRNEEDLGRLGDIVQNIERAIQAEIFYPVQSPLNCSTCPYRGPCKEWGKTPSEKEFLTLETMAHEAQ
jgi:CRISPR/Cas system-associated exonuclease Cas4 (RecB family)